MSEYKIDWRYINDPDAPDIDLSIDNLTSSLAESASQIKNTTRNFINPQFVEFFGSFNRFGEGVPSGIANYTNGNYVLTVNGNAGDSFVTVVSGAIADAGTTTMWACVIENNEGLFDVNQVTGTDGVSKVNLLEPLKETIVNKRLGNLHDAVLGQHYTELGYYAFAEHIYNMSPKYTERNSFIAQFNPTDTSGSWVSPSGAFISYNNVVNMKDTNNYFDMIGSSRFSMSASKNTDSVQWTQALGGQKGYLETYMGVGNGTATVTFTLDGVVTKTVTIGPTVQRLVFDYDGAQTGVISITSNGPYIGGTPRQNVLIGLTTWWVNGKFQNTKLVNPSEKVVYIGDSWGVNQTSATTRELTRLMQADGGTPTVLNYSLGGHTSTYALTWFDQYVIANNPDKVIIEYFTNDFNSIGGTNVGTFTNPSGAQQDMNISSLTQYLSNMNTMINKAIQNGIQPIVIMPCSTNSDSQTQSFANYGVQIWLGQATTNLNPTFKTTTADTTTTGQVTSKASTGVGSGTLLLSSTEINSSVRKGVMSDTNTGASITNGDIHGFYNNGTRKAGVKYDGTFDTPFLFLEAQPFGVSISSTTRGTIYIINSAGTNNIDELRAIVKLGDGSYVQRYITLDDKSNATPTSGYYGLGTKVVNTAPISGGYVGWVCVTAGVANGTPWAVSTAYTVGQQVNANGKVYQCTVAGTSGTTAPSFSSGTATDGTVTWQYINSLAVFKTYGLIS